ncbi:LysR family transcriptional regulator [Pendulispora rubella]|uniref:LysR family transcriptional regulator n=1 Tax=Pendulispora rubella TaxID=2741070 RepID=A0ABZ2LDH4_9BACT
MEIRHLRSFLAIAAELHFGRAARRVGITQPALSQQLRQMERELGTRLVGRTPSVALTDSGRVLAEHGEALMARWCDALEATRRAGQTVRPRLRIGFLEYVNPPFLAATLRALREAVPEVIVETRNLYSREVVAGLVEGTLDIGLTTSPVEHPTLALRPLLEGKWLVAMPARHPLRRHDTVPVEALRDAPLVFSDRQVNPPIYDWLIAQFVRAGVEPRIAYTTTQPQIGLDLVVEGVGLYVVASYVLRQVPDGIVTRPLTGFDTAMRLSAVWRADDKRPTVRAFLDALPRRPRA